MIEADNKTPLKKIITAKQLLDDTKKFGTPQFSRMARLAFISNQYLKGFVSKKIIKIENVNSFY